VLLIHVKVELNNFLEHPHHDVKATIRLSQKLFDADSLLSNVATPAHKELVSLFQQKHISISHFSRAMPLKFYLTKCSEILSKEPVSPIPNATRLIRSYIKVDMNGTYPGENEHVYEDIT